MTRDVFISHASEDAGVAAEVCTLLEARGMRCWIAPRDVSGGAVWDEAILDAIEGSRVFVLMLSEKANQSPYVKNEVNVAFSQSKPIVTFRLEDVAPGRSLKLYLVRHHWTDGFPGPLGVRVEGLAASIATHLDAKGAGGEEAAATEGAGRTPNTETLRDSSLRGRTSRPGRDEEQNAGHSARNDNKGQGRAWWRGKVGLVIAAVVLLASLAGGGWYYRSGISGGAAIDSVAVLPFVNGSGDPNMEYLSDGIAENLIDSLSQLPHFRVMSRDSAFRYKGKDVDAEAIGNALGVRAVFKGRLAQVGDNLEISAELIDARDDSHIWGDQYTRKAADVLALQGEIAKEISAALRVRLTGADTTRLAKNYTENPDAYQEYLKGLYWMNKANPEGINKGIESFRQAIATDPNYALAYAGLSYSYTLLGGLALDPPKEVYPKAEDAARKALELDDTLAEAHTSLATIKAIFEWDWPGAENEFQRAVALDPNSASTHYLYGMTFLHMGRTEQAIAEATRALALDPLSLPMNRGLGDTYYYARKYDQATEQLRKTLELDPNFELAHGDLSLMYSVKSMHEEAIAEAEKDVALDSRATTLSNLAYAYANAGNKAEAQKVLDRLSELSKHEYVQPRILARVYVGLGDKEKAFEYLEKSYQDRSIGTSFGLINTDPTFDPLRSDPRFADLLRRMNLTP